MIDHAEQVEKLVVDPEGVGLNLRKVKQVEQERTHHLGRVEHAAEALLHLRHFLAQLLDFR